MTFMRFSGGLAAALVLVCVAVTPLYAADPVTPADKPAFKQEELEQMLAPIALYPDSLLSQILMASTYPLEVVQADRWIKPNAAVKGEALTAALELQSWDPSVKSLCNFPPVLAMMSEKLDITVKIGDAFIGQQKDVMATIQKLRAKAQEAGNLKTTPEQTVVVDKADQAQVIVIKAANPQVVYIPTYNPVVVYGAWPYPTYPPPPYYPPGYVASNVLSFAAGVAIGSSWGYAWGHCNWHGGDVDIDINRNTNINANINRSKYQAEFQSRNTNIQNGKGSFQHDAAHRQGVAYRDTRTASKFSGATSVDAAKARESFRGRAETGPQQLPRGAADNNAFGGAGNRATPADRSVSSPRATPAASTADRSGAGARSSPSAATRDSGAFEGVNRGGTSARQESSRGSSSRSAPSRPSTSSRSGGGRR